MQMYGFEAVTQSLTHRPLHGPRCFGGDFWATWNGLCKVIGKGDPLLGQCFNVGRFDQRVAEHGQGVTSPLVYSD